MISANELEGLSLANEELMTVDSISNKLNDTKPVPSLSEDGWIRDPSLKINAMLAHYMVVDAAQSNIYSGNIISLKSTMSNYDLDNPEVVIEKIESDLTILFNRYFDETTVNVYIENEDSSYGKAVIDISVTTNGQTFDNQKSFDLAEFENNMEIINV